MTENGQSDQRGVFALVGAVLGGAVGFLLRPSNILTGQLDFGTVITRGANLTGLDALLRSQAESSFNMMFFAALVGAGIGFAIAASRNKG